MKISLLLFFSILFYTQKVISQNKGAVKINFIHPVSATWEQQVTGANSPNGVTIIFEITWKSGKKFFLNNISGYINNVENPGKIIYNKTVLDSTEILKGSSFTTQFEINATSPKMRKKPGSKESALEGRTNTSGNEMKVIRVSFLFNNKRLSFKIRCAEKKISSHLQLPQ